MSRNIILVVGNTCAFMIGEVVDLYEYGLKKRNKAS